MNEWIAEKKRLDEEERVLTKQIGSSLFMKERLWGVQEPDLFKQYDDGLRTARKTEKRTLQTSFGTTKENVQQLEGLLTQEHIHKSDVDRIAVLMEKIDKSLKKIKSVQREVYDILLESEEELQASIQSKIYELERASELDAISLSQHQKRSVRIQDRTLSIPEVQAYEEFVAENGGLNGGWTVYDHGVFLKVRDKISKMHSERKPQSASSGVATLCRKVSSALAGQTEGSVLVHEQWWCELNYLNEAKKAALKQWREKKKQEDDARRREEADKAKAQRLKLEKKRIEREKRRRERQEQAAREVQTWKEQKHAEQQERVKKHHEKQRQLALQEERTKQLHQQKIRAKVEAYQTQKQQQEKLEQVRQEQLELERQRQAKEATKALKVFRQRDEEALAVKQKEQLELERQEKEKEARLDRLRAKVSSQVKVERDPSRLIQHNASSRRRQEEMQRERHQPRHRLGTGSGFVNHAPRLAIPNWRKGL